LSNLCGSVLVSPVLKSQKTTNMKNLFVFLFVFLMVIPTYAQRDETLLRNPGLKLTGLWGGSTSRIHNFSDKSHYAHGGYFTFEFNKDYLVGWNGFEVKAYNEGIGDIDVSTSGLLIGYAHNSYSIVHPVAYLSLGRAESRADGLPTVHSLAGQATIGAEFNLFRWVRLGAEVGYRYIHDKDVAWISDAGLSAPYAGIKLKFGWSWGKSNTKPLFRVSIDSTKYLL
jgi:hypothetical protein